MNELFIIFENIFFPEDEEAIKKTWTSQTTDHEMDEFLPDVSDEMNISLLKKVSENADVSQFYKVPNASGADEEDDDEDSEVPSDLLLTSDKIPEIEEEEATAGSFPSSLEDEIALPRAEYDALAPSTVHFGDSSDDSDDSISRGLNFNDVTVPDNGASASGSGATALTSGSAHVSGSSAANRSDNTSSQLPASGGGGGGGGGHSPTTWNIVSNLWDAAHSTFPEIVGRPPRRRVTAELSSDESDFELLDTDDFNINATTTNT